VDLGSEGWVHVDRSGIDAEPKSLLDHELSANDLRLLSSNNHHGNFIDAIRGRSQPASPIDASVRSDTLAWLDQIAIQLRRKLRWDPVREDFVGDPEASARLDRPMRAPWSV